MLLTLTTSMSNATDLGFLLHKHPDKAQSFDVAGGTAHVVWPEATAERSTVALLLEVDPIALVRGRDGRGGDGFSLSQYVNDRPYAASSMLSVALRKVFGTAMTGRSDARPDLAAQPVPLEVHLPALPSRGGVDLVQRLFAPLGWAVTTTPIPLDPQIPAWGASPYVDLRLQGTVRVTRALGHKRSLAAREYALGLESLERAVGREPLWRVHEAVFAVLALESEPVDPRL